jgi:membrane protease YdiL (CAAX protease family)
MPEDDRFARRLRGFGPLGLLAILVILLGYGLITLLGAILVLIWVSVSNTPWHEIGYVRPKSWARSLVIGVVFGAAFKFAMKAIVMPFNAGFGEETIFRGWMFERLGKLFGQSVIAKTLIVLATSALFAAAHYSSQGLPGVEQAAITGLIFGTIFAATGRIFTLMIAHAAFDLAALAMIYCDVEPAIAHLVFKRGAR